MAVGPPPTGDELLRVLAALANPHRLRIVAALMGGRDYVSRLAREIGMSRPLLHMHLQRLEAAGLIVGSLELSAGGKATRYFEVMPFLYELTPELIAGAASSLTGESERKPVQKPSRRPGATKTSDPADPVALPKTYETPQKEDPL